MTRIWKRCRSMKLPNYYMFIDESGDASLNNKGKDFFLSTVIIKQDDFEIIKGYMKLLKRRFFDDDYKILHATDLFERPYEKYRKLCVPKNSINAFIRELQSMLKTVPYHSAVYRVDKDALRKKLGYLPAKGRKSKTINLDLPYEMASMEAIFDFTKFLKSQKSTGEITIESRLHKDSNFVSYFDNTRKDKLPGGKPNPAFADVRKSIPSLFISNKDSGNSGLELVDLVSYITYRKTVGDPYNHMKIEKANVDVLYAAIVKSAYLGAPNLVHNVS